MKRGGQLIRRRRLEARKPWRPTRAPLPAKSAKREAEDRVRFRLKSEYIAGHQWCEMCGLPWNEFRQPDIHERFAAGRGGSRVEVANFVALCRSCHDHVTRNPAWAEANGWALKTGAAQ